MTFVELLLREVLLEKQIIILKQIKLRIRLINTEIQIIRYKNCEEKGFTFRQHKQIDKNKALISSDVF